jgi:alpha-mannosidase
MHFQHVATLASLYKLYNPDYVYPKARIDDNWEKVLLNQCKPFITFRRLDTDSLGM